MLHKRFPTRQADLQVIFTTEGGTSNIYIIYILYI